MNKILIVLFFLGTPYLLKAQTRYQQITLGGGLGAATAYAGESVPETEAAFYADVAYYPVPEVFFDAQAQFGSLGGKATTGSLNQKAFANRYQSAMITGQLFLGVFYPAGDNSFLNFIRNFYGGTGYGVMANNVRYTDLSDPKVIDQTTNTLRFVPINGGYEFNWLKNRFNEPVLKVNISSSFYYIMGKGLDGYTSANSYANSFSFYTYYSIGLKYTLIIHGGYGRSYNKFD